MQNYQCKFFEVLYVLLKCSQTQFLLLSTHLYILLRLIYQIYQSYTYYQYYFQTELNKSFMYQEIDCFLSIDQMTTTADSFLHPGCFVDYPKIPYFKKNQPCAKTSQQEKVSQFRIEDIDGDQCDENNMNIGAELFEIQDEIPIQTSIYQQGTHLQEEQYKIQLKQKKNNVLSPKPLFVMVPKRKPLMIQISKQIENKYCPIMKGSSNQTKQLNRMAKIFFYKIANQSILLNNIQEKKDINRIMQFKSNQKQNFELIQRFFGVIQDKSKNIRVSDQADHLRMLINDEMINPCFIRRIIINQRKELSNVNNNHYFNQRLIKLKYMNLLHRGVQFPQKFNKWKEN